MTTPTPPAPTVAKSLPELPEKAYQMGGKGHSDDAMRAYALSAISAHEAEVGRLRKLLQGVLNMPRGTSGRIIVERDDEADLRAALTQGETK